MRILYPYKNALWALRPAKPLGVLSRHPCRNTKPLPRGEGLCMLGWLCIVQSLLAYTPGIRAGAILLGLPPLVQARMLAVSHTKPLHDAVAQMADDLYGGSAPATPFLSTKEVFRQSESCGETYISSQLFNIQIRSQYFRTFCTAIITSAATVL